MGKLPRTAEGKTLIHPRKGGLANDQAGGRSHKEDAAGPEMRELLQTWERDSVTACEHGKGRRP